jgi:ribonuclease E
VKKPARKSAAKRPAKKAVAVPAEATAAEAEPAPVRAPRKRAAKKVTIPTEVALLAPEPSALTFEPAAAAEQENAVEPVEAALAELIQQGGSLPVEPTEALLEDLPAVAAVDESLTLAEVAVDAPDEKEPELVDDESEGDEDSGPRRRRRRRGGRRRRRGGSGDEDSQTDGPEDSGESAGLGETEAGGPAVDAGGPTAPSESDDADDSEGSEDSEGQRRRRRRRRRRGEDTGSADDDPTEVVVRVREPRTKKKASEVTGIEGSTRLEAKRQRRRDGREAGRRRAPILSEAEFLTRRESVERTMVVRQRDDLTQIAVLEDEILVEHYVDRDSAASLIGNVYLGRVQNVLPSMEAAFIDIGRGRNAVLYAGEVDWDSFGAEGQARKVEKVFKSGQPILVQVTKDPVGAKGARLTNHVSIPGRYLVYAPGGHLSGISRKLPDNERKRLKDILADLVGDAASVIVRTAAEGAGEDELVRDVNRLKAQWADIEKKVQSGSAPQLLYGEPDLTVRIVRDLFTEDFGKLVIQGNGSMTDAYDSVEAYVTHVAPHLADRLSRWEPEDNESDGGTDGSGRDLFTEYRIDEQIAKAVERKVFLPSGGSLVIDRTEAMTVIDVNTGKFTGSGGNLEATVTSNNLEAAEEIVNQLRLRDIGGIIVIDFIDMVLPANRELLLRRLVECLGRDRTRHQVAEVTSLGLVQMTRKKIGTGLLEAFSTECPHCHGRGYEVHDLPVESQQQPDGGSRAPGRDRPLGPSSGGRRGQSGANGGRSGGGKGGGSGSAAEPSALTEVATGGS